MTDKLDFEFNELEKSDNEDDILADRESIFKEDLDEDLKDAETEELKEKYKEYQDDKKERKIDNPDADKIKGSIFGMLGITFDNLILSKTGAEPLSEQEAKSINDAGRLMDNKYKVLEKFGIEINYIGSIGIPFMRSDRLEVMKRNRNKKGDIDANKHE